MTEGPALSVRGKRVLRFKFVSFKSLCRALRVGGTGSVGPGVFLSGARVFLLGVGAVVRACAVGMFGTDGAHPSEGDRERVP